jgi:hypothetical protein
MTGYYMLGYVSSGLASLGHVRTNSICLGQVSPD